MLKRKVLDYTGPQAVRHSLKDSNLSNEAPRIWEAAENIRKYSSLGEQLMAHLEDAELPLREEDMGKVKGRYCYYGDYKRAMPRGTEGYCEILLNPGEKKRYEELLAHEAFHSYQHIKYGLFNDGRAISLRERILNSLLAEAGAETMAIAICHQMRENGVSEPFENGKNCADHEKTYSWLFRVFDRHVNEAEGEAADRASYAASCTFNAYLNCAGLVHRYAQGVIEQYVYEVHAEQLSMPVMSGDMSLTKARRYSAHLLSDIEIPVEDNSLFVGSKRLRQLVDWVETERMLRAKEFNADDWEYQRARAALRQDDNPFVKISFHQLYKKLRTEPRDENGDRRKVLAIASELAGLSEGKQAHFTFNDAAKADKITPIKAAFKPVLQRAP